MNMYNDDDEKLFNLCRTIQESGLIDFLSYEDIESVKSIYISKIIETKV